MRRKISEIEVIPWTGFTKTETALMCNNDMPENIDEYESWYKTVINNNRGIFIGNGILDQMTIKLLVLLSLITYSILLLIVVSLIAGNILRKVL